MFAKKRAKTKTELMKAQAADKAVAVMQKVAPATEAAKVAAAGTAAAASHYAAERAAQAASLAAEKTAGARAAAAKRVEKDAPKLQDAVYGIAPHVDKAHDSIVDEVLPAIAKGIAAVAASAAAANATADRKDTDISDVVEALKSGKVQKKGKGGKLLITLGLAALGGAAYLFTQQQKKTKTDPWAVPATDPYAVDPATRSAALPTDGQVSAVENLDAPAANNGDQLLDEDTNESFDPGIGAPRETGETDRQIP